MNDARKIRKTSGLADPSNYSSINGRLLGNSGDLPDATPGCSSLLLASFQSEK